MCRKILKMRSKRLSNERRGLKMAINKGGFFLAGILFALRRAKESLEQRPRKRPNGPSGRWLSFGGSSDFRPCLKEVFSFPAYQGWIERPEHRGTSFAQLERVWTLSDLYKMAAYSLRCYFPWRPHRVMFVEHCFGRRTARHGWTTYLPRCPKHRGSRGAVSKRSICDRSSLRGCVSSSSTSTTSATI